MRWPHHVLDDQTRRVVAETPAAPGWRIVVQEASGETWEVPVVLWRTLSIVDARAPARPFVETHPVVPIGDQWTELEDAYDWHLDEGAIPRLVGPGEPPLPPGT